MRWYSSATFTILSLLTISSPILTAKIAVPNIRPQQAVLKANAVIIGKVVEIEKDPVEAATGPNQPKMSYTVAIIKIEDALVGARGLTQVRVGFAGVAKADPNQVPPNDNVRTEVIRPVRGPLPGQNILLTKDQEGLFFLNKHPSGDFYVPIPFVQPVAKTTEGFGKQIASLKATLKIVEKPVEALKATEAKDRQTAAMVLLSKYTVRHFGLDTEPMKQVPIPADENKLILSILSEMEWSKVEPETGLGLSSVWYSLGVLAHGWKQPAFQPNQDANKVMTESIQSFLKENKDKIRIQMLVPETPAPKK